MIARDLLAPAKPADQTYQGLRAVLRKYYKKTPITVAERRKFIRRDQAPGESTKDYVVQLKHLSLHCQFAEKLDEQLRDRFISGIRDDGTALKLMEKSADHPNMTFNEAVTLATDREVTAGEARAMRAGTTGGGTSVHALGTDYRRRATSSFPGQGYPGKSGQGDPGQRKGYPGASSLSGRFGAGREQSQKRTSFECYRCGQQGHMAKNCSFQGQCHKCGRTGHISRKCRSKEGYNYKPNARKERDSSRKRDFKKSSIKKVESETKAQSGEKYDNEYHDERVCDDKGYDEYVRTTMFKNSAHSANSNRSDSTPPPIMVDVEIEGHMVAMEVDTGSGVSIIPYSLYRQYFAHLQLEPSSKVFVSISPGEVTPRGKVEVKVKYGNFEGSVILYVVDTEFVLFGRDWLYTIKLDWASIVHYERGHTSRSSTAPTQRDSVKAVRSLDEILGRHARLFENRLGKLTQSKAHVVVRADAQPVVTKPYRVPYAMQDPVDKELNRLQENGVLTPIAHSQWSTGIVAVPKKDGSVRICGNYKTTVNPNLEPVPPPNINVEDILANLSGGILFSKLDLAHAYNQL